MDLPSSNRNGKLHRFPWLLFPGCGGATVITVGNCKEKKNQEEAMVIETEVKREGTVGHLLDGECWCCVIVCSLADLCLPLPAGLETVQNFFLVDQQVTKPALFVIQLGVF